MELNLSAFHPFSRCDLFASSSHECVEHTQLGHVYNIQVSNLEKQKPALSLGLPAQ